MKRFRQIVALVLTLAMLVSAAPMQAFAEENADRAVSEVRFYPDCEADAYITISNAEATLEVPFNTTINPYKFEIAFDDPSKIGYAWVTSTVNGVRKTLGAVYDDQTEMFVAEGFFDPENHNYIPSDIRVEYSEKSSCPEIGSEVDWETMQSHLDQNFMASTVNNTNDGDNSTGTVEFSEALDGLRDVTMEYYIKTVVDQDDQLKEIRSYYTTGENILSYVVPGMDDSRYIAYLDLTDPNDCRMMIDDGLDVGGKIIEISMSFMDKSSLEYMSLDDASALLSHVGTVVDLAYDLNNIQSEMDGLEEEIASSGYFSDEEEAALLKEVDNLAKDRTRFTLLITALPLIVAGGVVSAPAAAIFSGMIAIMSTASEAVYEHRLSGIQDQIADATFKAVGVGNATEYYSWHFLNGTMTISGSGALPAFGLTYTWPTGPNTIDHIDKKSIKTLILQDGITDINYGNFGSCFYLTSVQLPLTLKSIGQYAFQACKRLPDIVIPDGVEYLDLSAFTGCEALTSITIPDTVKKLYTEIPTGCSALTDIYYEGTVDQWEQIEDHEQVAVYHDPAEWTTEGVWIHMQNQGTFGDSRWSFNEETGELWISGASVMTDIKEYGYSSDYISRSDIKYPWRHCGSRIKSVRFAEGIEDIGDNALRNHTSLEKIYFPESLKSIGTNAFAGCTGLTEVTIPGNTELIGAYAFSGCSNIENVTLPDGLSVIYSGAFEGCDKLEAIVLPDSLTYLAGNVFANCVSLKSANLPATQCSWKIFAGCRNLTDVTLADGLTVIPSYTFDGCTSLSEIEIPNSVTSIGDSAFDYCTSLTTLVIPDSVTELGSGLFYGCTALESVVLPRFITELDEDLFYGCTALEEVVIPESVKTIGEAAFRGCTSLQEIVIPAGVQQIEGDIFSDCTALSKITFLGSAPEPKYSWESNIFTNVTADAYYPAGDETWTEEIRSEYGGTINWIPYTTSDPAEPEVPEVTGMTRIFGATRYDTAFKAADQLKANLGIEKFQNIVVAYGEDFADALSGSYLANQKNAPILLVKNRNKEINLVKDYIKANLTPGGTVYLLGGINAVPKAMESGLEGFNVKRLAGATRYETNLEILKEAGVSGNDILVCTGLDFADGLSASAVNKPILLVKDSLRTTQVNYLKTLGTKNFYLIGGTNAVNKRIESALSTYGTTQRIEGATRYYTSVNIAKTFFPDAQTAVLAYAQNFPDGLSGGCLACSMNAPLILTANGKQAPAVAYAKEAGITGGAVLGGTGLIPDRVANAIFRIS